MRSTKSCGGRGVWTKPWPRIWRRSRARGTAEDVQAPADDSLLLTTLHLLHTNDFHNHLSAAQAQAIRQAKAELENVLLLDAGDAISAGNVGVRPGGEPILTLMSETGYDAMTLGNREFHVADTLLRLKIGKAAFPILCANMRWREDRGETLPTVPHMVKTLPNGLRVGVFGLTVPMVTPRMTARLVSAFVFDDPVAAAQAQIALLRPTGGCADCAHAHRPAGR